MATVTLTPTDTRLIDGANADTNYLTNAALVVGAGAANRKDRDALRFDLSAIPAGSVVTSVSLALTMYTTVGASDLTAYLNAILQPAVYSELTWNRYDAAHTWQTAGCNGASDRVATASASVVIPVSPSSTVVTFASTTQLVADVQGWLDSPSTNNGWLLSSPASEGSASGWARTFRSADYGTAGERPALSVTYNPPHLVLPTETTDQRVITDDRQFWAFWLAGGNLLYARSDDGLRWGAGAVLMAATTFDVVRAYSSGRHAFYVLADNRLYEYRVDGTTLVQLTSDTSATAIASQTYARLLFDSTQRPMVVARAGSGPYTAQLAWGDARYVCDIDDHTETITTLSGSDARVRAVALGRPVENIYTTPDDIYAVVDDNGSLGGYLRDRLTGTWGAKEDLGSTSAVGRFALSALRDGSPLLLRLASGGTLYARKRTNGTWGSEVTVATGVTACAVASCQASDTAVLFYVDGAGVKYRTWDGSTLGDTTALAATTTVSDFRAQPVCSETAVVSWADDDGTWAYSVPVPAAMPGVAPADVGTYNIVSTNYSSNVCGVSDHRFEVLVTNGFRVGWRRSADGGETWSNRNILAVLATGDSHLYPNASLDAAKYVWVVFDGYDAPGVESHPRVFKSDWPLDSASWDGGFTEQTGPELNTGYRRLLFDQDGIGYLFYRYHSSVGLAHIAVARWDGAAWSEPVYLVTGTEWPGAYLPYPVQVRKYPATVGGQDRFMVMWVPHTGAIGTSVNAVIVEPTGTNTYALTDAAGTAVTLPALEDDGVVWDAAGATEYTDFYGDIDHDASDSDHLRVVYVDADTDRDTDRIMLAEYRDGAWERTAVYATDADLTTRAWPRIFVGDNGATAIVFGTEAGGAPALNRYTRPAGGSVFVANSDEADAMAAQVYPLGGGYALLSYVVRNGYTSDALNITELGLFAPPAPDAVTAVLDDTDIDVTITESANNEDGYRWKVAYDGLAYGAPTTVAGANPTGFTFTPEAGHSWAVVAACLYNDSGDSVYVESEPVSLVQHFTGSATIACTSGVSATGTLHATGSATIAATSALSASGVLGAKGSATVGATASVSATGHLGAFGSATIAAVSAVVVASEEPQHHTGSATVACTAAVSATGRLGAKGAATVAATASVAAAGVLHALGSAVVACVSAVQVSILLPSVRLPRNRGSGGVRPTTTGHGGVRPRYSGHGG